VSERSFYAFLLRLCYDIVKSHKNTTRTFLPNYTINVERESYRDEESPVATKQPNSINVFTQFNSPSALSIVDARKFIKTLASFRFSLPFFLLWHQLFLA
jgi:hypothetical protein